MDIIQMRSRNGKPVPNQFIIRTKEGSMFRSYISNIAFIPADVSPIQLGKDWDCSTTTGKDRNIFLGIDKAETERRLKNGDYVLNVEL